MKMTEIEIFTVFDLRNLVNSMGYGYISRLGRNLMILKEFLELYRKYVKVTWNHYGNVKTS